MSEQLISRSADLKQLQDEGYDIEVRAGFLLIHNVPYVNAAKDVKRGILISTLHLVGDVTAQPDTHVASFIGEYPCDKDGVAIGGIQHAGKQTLDRDLIADYAFSAKPPGAQYRDYYDKMTTYTRILAGPAQAVDPAASPIVFNTARTSKIESLFNYTDTASSRAGLNAISRKLELGKIAIVGLGGTGTYVLDLVAKTRVGEIHVFDGDKLSNHNAFRAPGAASVEELRAHPTKVGHYVALYSKMRRAIHPHEYHINASTLDELQPMEFVFLCLDTGEDKQVIVRALEEWRISFTDVGIGVDVADQSVQGMLRVTTSTPQQRNHVHTKQRIHSLMALGTMITPAISRSRI